MGHKAMDMNWKHRMKALEDTALAAVSFVGLANYSEREAAAKKAIRLSAETFEFVDPETCLRIDPPN
jgi:hypothetical protein